VFVLDGTTVVEAAGQAGIILNQPCGGGGTCGKCRVEVLEGAPEPVASEQAVLSPAELADGWRLACQMTIRGHTVITVPPQARFFEQKILVKGRERAYSLDPSLRKVCVSVPEGSTDDPRSDMDRVRDAIAADEYLRVDLELLRALPGMLRRSDNRVTFILEGDEIQNVESGDTTDSVWGVAFDIGTTTLVGSLMDLRTGQTAAVAGRTNPQTHFGDDVVTRISYIESHDGGLARLRARLLGAMNAIIAELCESAGIECESVYAATAVGNTTMSHIFLGIDPTSIGHAPYLAVFREAVDCRARTLDVAINPDANLHVLPNIAGFVGSDTIGVVLASGMAHDDRVQLAIDIGTNGEVVIGNRDRMLACSCAAGPALEGARIQFGMRASEGAISKVVFNDTIETSVIGGGAPTGICGSGLIDAVAQALDCGLVDPTGRIVAPDEVPEARRESLVEHDGQPAICLVPAERTRMGQAIVLTQKDFREVQLATAAIRAGVQVLMSEFGVGLDELEAVLVAGGFGNFIRRSHAQRMGLLPGVPHERIEYIGNAAATGARMALACRSCRAEAEDISRRIEYIELATRADFQMHYMDAMEFPSGDH
jgi:uncharacterized 2Fe-2S/4Fe-4S cluster protein (DUF4445 family)